MVVAYDPDNPTYFIWLEAFTISEQDEEVLDHTLETLAIDPPEVVEVPPTDNTDAQADGHPHQPAPATDKHTRRGPRWRRWWRVNHERTQPTLGPDEGHPARYAKHGRHDRQCGEYRLHQLPQRGQHLRPGRCRTIVRSTNADSETRSAHNAYRSSISIFSSGVRDLAGNCRSFISGGGGGSIPSANGDRPAKASTRSARCSQSGDREPRIGRQTISDAQGDAMPRDMTLAFLDLSTFSRRQVRSESCLPPAQQRLTHSAAVGGSERPTEPGPALMSCISQRPA